MMIPVTALRQRSTWILMIPSIFIDQLVASLGVQEQKEMIKKMMKMTVEMTPLVMRTMARCLQKVKKDSPDLTVMRILLTLHNPLKTVPYRKIAAKIPPVRTGTSTVKKRRSIGLREVTLLGTARVRNTGWEAAVRGRVATGMVLSSMMKECRVMTRTAPGVREATPG
jgi:hypothetical protein